MGARGGRGKGLSSAREGRGGIRKEDVKHLAWLARVRLSRKELDALAGQLSEVLDYFHKIDEVNTENVEPTYHVLDLTNIFRRDEPKDSPGDAVLRNVPETRDRYVKAPRMG